MSKKIGVVFATRNAIQPTLEAFAQYAPGTGVQIFVDEGLLPAVQEANGVTAPLLRRFASLIARAEESKVDGILFSCSVFSPTLDVLKPLFSVPLMSVDLPMLEEAVSSNGAVGVIATVAQAEKLTVEQLQEQAAKRGACVTVHSTAVPDAFAALSSAPEKHDSLIFEAAQKLAEKCDRFVLAQISMARASAKVATLGKPVLTSTESSVKAIMAAVADN